MTEPLHRCDDGFGISVCRSYSNDNRQNSSEVEVELSLRHKALQTEHLAIATLLQALQAMMPERVSPYSAVGRQVGLNRITATVDLLAAQHIQAYAYESSAISL